ncbi:hypothetical protein [Phenylobacterium sp.]|uniref:hypothetical protein n=1 Tax=Phenylobacterium sp. TaxID=1871053 RepID=UPI002FC64630
MPLKKQRALRMQSEGYWAVEIRLAESNAVRPRYICHASNDRHAQNIAGDLMGPTSGSHGFNYYRLQLPITDRATAGLPNLGGWEKVGSETWSNLMASHAASEAAFEASAKRS